LLGNSSGEIEIIRPIDAEFLVVVGTVEAELDLCSTHELPVGEEEAAVDFLTVSGIGIDLAFLINSAH